MNPGQLLENAKKLSGIRGVVVQGRYDLLCPPSTAHTLLTRWPDARLRMVETAGHSLYDPGVREAVVAAIEDVSRV